MVTGLSASNYENSTLDLKTFTRALDRLRNESEYLRHQYNTAQPYPHLVIDDLFEPELLEQLVADFPQAQDRDWLIWDTKVYSPGGYKFSDFFRVRAPLNLLMAIVTPLLIIWLYGL